MDIASPAARAALEQATKRWPARSRASDGILPSPTHLVQSPNSDHNSGNAFDLTHDPAHGVDCFELAAQLVARAKAGKEPRVKYVIWNRQIASPAEGWSWRPYDGRNPHTKHMHVSIVAAQRGSTATWWPTSGVPSDRIGGGEVGQDHAIIRLQRQVDQLRGDVNTLIAQVRALGS